MQFLRIIGPSRGPRNPTLSHHCFRHIQPRWLNGAVEVPAQLAFPHSASSPPRPKLLPKGHGPAEFSRGRRPEWLVTAWSGPFASAEFIFVGGHGISYHRGQFHLALFSALDCPPPQVGITEAYCRVHADVFEQHGQHVRRRSSSVQNNLPSFNSIFSGHSLKYLIDSSAGPLAATAATLNVVFIFELRADGR